MLYLSIFVLYLSDKHNYFAKIFNKKEYFLQRFLKFGHFAKKPLKNYSTCLQIVQKISKIFKNNLNHSKYVPYIQNIHNAKPLIDVLLLVTFKIFTTLSQAITTNLEGNLFIKIVNPLLSNLIYL